MKLGQSTFLPPDELQRRKQIYPALLSLLTVLTNTEGWEAATYSEMVVALSDELSRERERIAAREKK